MVPADTLLSVARITGNPPQLTRGLVEDYNRRYQYIDGTPTYEAFSHTPFDIQDTVRDSLAWLAKNNMLKPEMAAKLETT